MTKKINKYIEIVMIPDDPDGREDREEIGFQLKEKIFSDILRTKYTKVSVSLIKTKSDLECLVAKKPDLVFSGVKFFRFNGEKLWFTDYLDDHGIAYVGTGKKAYINSSRKNIAKEIMQKAGVTTADFFTTEPGEHTTVESIPIAFPLFVKPEWGDGGGTGIDPASVVFDLESFQAKVADIYRNQKVRSMVETYLSGKEYTVGIFEDRANDDFLVMPIEMVVNKNKNGHRILDFDAKQDELEAIAIEDPKIHDQVSELAKSAFRALKAKSYGRVDIRMDDKGVPHFLEANLIPALKKNNMYRTCLINQNMGYEQMILTITYAALSFKEPWNEQCMAA